MTISPATFSDDLYGLRPLSIGVYRSSMEAPEADVRIVTSGGLSIPAHSSVLASSSRVMEKILDQPRKYRNSNKIIQILGVTNEAVVTFIQFLYSSRCSEEEIDMFGMHLLALSHVYSVSKLKQRCTKGLAGRLTVENVIDVLKLARLCDAPDLYLKCMKVVSKQFKAVELTEGWQFLHDHDPWLELEILQYLDEVDSREKRRRKNRNEQSLYVQLSEAMDCLEHICTEGCTTVGPYDMDPLQSKKPCSKISTCQGLQLLIRHFATCTKRVNGGCSRCKRMWQLLKLHSCMCDESDHCRVPLCRQFKLKMGQDRKGDNARWRLLVRKVVSAKVMSSLSMAKRIRCPSPRLK
ncbi:BTB/POZ and TAZ domain-containing protein [Thalictrum thalictroides]|uniref:BTB/POZ and TAZ domain-containing protein n=1 Tax=Thalictrum thalictroides TaxID=46969 RepID=A0A7J6X0N2_THATH|nr:BTB/POZ and TAZ domain-containing protein [Thalictrum thalictroides]